MKICFATNNKNKLKEIKAILGDKIEILSLNDIGCDDELPEDFETLEENSTQKARYVFEKFGIPCFADDTGLFVKALKGAPGVFSARYAGPEADSAKNLELLMANMILETDRAAYFKTIITYIGSENEIVQFDGVVNGNIAEEKMGEKGFGYDPVFVPEGYSESFAQLSAEEKNKISHRGIATQKLIEYLKGKVY